MYGSGGDIRCCRCCYRVLGLFLLLRLCPASLNDYSCHSQIRVDIVIVIAGGCDALNTVFLLFHSFVVRIYDYAKPPNR